MALGYALGVSIGVTLAVLVTSLPWGQGIVRPLMLGLFAVPKVSLAPVVIVWLGIYLAPKIALSASLVLFIVYFNTVAGITSVNPRNPGRAAGNGSVAIRAFDKAHFATRGALYLHRNAHHGARRIDWRIDRRIPQR